MTITAQLADAGGNPVSTPALSVGWTSTGAGGAVVTTPTITNASGIATTTFTTSSTAGTVHTVTGLDGGGLTGTTANITTQPGPRPNIFSLRPFPPADILQNSPLHSW